MEKVHAYWILVITLTALFSFSRCDSVMKVIEGKLVNLTFPYPCDSYKVTLQRSNGTPFYSSIASDNYHFPNYQQERFSVQNVNCSLYLEINPVLRDDEATYISQAYREGVTQNELTRVRINVDHAPGKVSCVESNEYSIDDWVSLQCTAPVGSLDGQIQCFQDAVALPPANRLDQTDGMLKQSIWVLQKYKHPVFCCSSLLDEPKDLCVCKDFGWENDQTDGIKYVDPCPVTIPDLVTGLTEYQRNNTEDYSPLTPFNAPVTETTCNTCINKDTKITVGVLFGVSIIINVILVMVPVYRHAQKTKKTRKVNRSEYEKRYSYRK